MGTNSTNVEIGINTFGLNDLLYENYDETVKQLGEIGYKVIEPLVLFPQLMGADDASIEARMHMAKKDGGMWPARIAKERIASLRSQGFNVYGIHLALVKMCPDGLNKVLSLAKNFAVENDIKYIIHSPQKETLEEIATDIDGFKNGIKLLSDAGIQLIFHCHFNEFEKCGDTTIFEHILQEVPELKVELDVGWVMYAKEDVIEIMKKYRDRISIIHFKDINLANCGETVDFTAIGAGDLPLKEIMDEAKNINLEYNQYIVDQDASSGDMMADLKVGYDNIMSYL
ncbi:MAG: sugar phosphate isomerase/epimerase [Lachnospiraceae bacterium]|nr:sugar phosphate isomerase/epimerase [Lachnospiraceae bacterium]